MSGKSEPAEVDDPEMGHDVLAGEGGARDEASVLTNSEEILCFSC
jgi:hypothetical protein